MVLLFCLFNKIFSEQWIIWVMTLGLLSAVHYRYKFMLILLYIFDFIVIVEWPIIWEFAWWLIPDIVTIRVIVNVLIIVLFNIMERFGRK